MRFNPVDLCINLFVFESVHYHSLFISDKQCSLVYRSSVSRMLRRGHDAASSRGRYHGVLAVDIASRGL